MMQMTFTKLPKAITAEEREIKAVPDYLWKAAEYIESVGNWQGTASELLAEVHIEGVQPNQFTYNMAKYFDKVFEPKGIHYKTHRKNKVRLLSFYGDDGDGLSGIPHPDN